MKTAQEIYPEAWAEEQNGESLRMLWNPLSYQPIIDSFGEVLIQVDDNDYSGDSRVLYRQDGRTI